MRILMLGWEFPPFIAGGLGTACYGLTRALDRRGHEITFVLPRAVDRSHSSHVKVLSPDVVEPHNLARAAAIVERVERNGNAPASAVLPPDESLAGIETYRSSEFAKVTFHAAPAQFTSPYGDFAALTKEQIGIVLRLDEERTRRAQSESMPVSSSAAATFPSDPLAPTPGFLGPARLPTGHYGGDLLGDVRRYAEMCVALTRGKSFDVIHAHDWLTCPAGVAVARSTGTPLVVHVHSTEFDRAGDHVNRQVYEIERRAFHSAMRVITVSFWTRNIVIHRYGVDPKRINVVWNGIDTDRPDVPRPPIASSDKIVLFLGRITMQKGPEYFIAAAKRVLEVLDNVKFIVAGSGDMDTRMIELGAQMGIGHKILFTGFLRGDDVARVFKMADCYVMPSVSEPFGIAPLEAMSHDVPVIISKQSGVSEALTHVLKVDFWDIDEMANKIIAVLRHPVLRQTLRQHGRMELRSLTWEGAAVKCEEVYREAVAGMAAVRAR